MSLNGIGTNIPWNFQLKRKVSTEGKKGEMNYTGCGTLKGYGTVLVQS